MGVEMKSEQGMVAFLDILGYSNFLENNEPEQAANTVLQTLLDLPKTILDLELTIMKHTETKDDIAAHLKKFKWAIFSDTIVLTNAYMANDSTITKGERWIMFMLNLTTVFSHLFVHGLPVRGAVCFGDYFVTQQCFAGRPIVKAHRLATRLDLAAIVFDDSAKHELQKSSEADESIARAMEIISLDYLIPMKNDPHEKMRVLMPSLPALPGMKTSDFRQFVLAGC
jgi:hypothetical protein